MLRIRSLLGPHMFIGLMLIPPLLLKLASTGARRRAVGGTGLRGMLVASAVGGGVALAIALLPAIGAWHLAR